VYRAIKQLDAAIASLREAQTGAAEFWREIDTPDSATLIAKHVPWRVMEEMDRRMYVLSVAVALAEAAALEVQAEQR